MNTKMKLFASLKIWIAIYPSITLYYFLFGKHLATLPLYQRTLFVTLPLVPWIVFAGIPFIDLVIKKLSAKTTKSKLLEMTKA